MKLLSAMGRTLLCVSLLMSQTTLANANVNPMAEAVRSFSDAESSAPASQILSPEVAEAIRTQGLSSFSAEQQTLIQLVTQKIQASSLDPAQMTKADFLNLYPELQEQNWGVIGVMFAVYIGFIVLVIGDNRNSQRERREESSRKAASSYNYRVQRELDSARIRKEKAEADKAEYDAARAREGR